jgi:hypothetical protein
MFDTMYQPKEEDDLVPRNESNDSNNSNNSKQPSEDMKTELKKFMKKHLTEEVSEFSFSDAPSFSEF